MRNWFLATGVDVADDSIQAIDIANGAITAGELADNRITSRKVVDSSLTGTDVVNNSLSGADIDERSLNGSQIPFGCGQFGIANYWADFDTDGPMTLNTWYYRSTGQIDSAWSCSHDSLTNSVGILKRATGFFRAHFRGSGARYIIPGPDHARTGCVPGRVRPIEVDGRTTR